MSMTRDELMAKLKSIEWDDIEFKAAAWEAPKSAMSTVLSLIHILRCRRAI